MANKNNSLGEIYVKVNGGITSIAKLTPPQFEAFLNLTDMIKAEYLKKKAQVKINQ